MTDCRRDQPQLEVGLAPGSYESSMPRA